MRTMGIVAVYPKQKLSQQNVTHWVYPYLLRNLRIDRPNQVWAADIRYLPMARGFVYLVAIMDWHSRKVLSSQLSNTMDSSFCVDALNEGIEQYGVPEIFSTDQGRQFTSDEFTGILKQHEVAISTDGRGRWTENVFIERLWRSVKYEEVYLKAYESMPEARQSLSHCFEFYDQRRQSLDKQTPDAVYYEYAARMAAGKGVSLGGLSKNRGPFLSN